MGKVKLDESNIVYIEGDKREILINLSDYLSNISRLPLHGDSAESRSLVKLLGDNYAFHISEMPSNERGDKLEDEYRLIDILLAQRLISLNQSIRVAEIGCTDGILSWHTANMLGMYHPDSLLCGVTETIGNDSDNKWLDYIVKVIEPCRVSLVASDYEDTNLRDNHFDIVIINGRERFSAPEKVIAEADRIAKRDGRVICFNVDQPLLSSTFKIAHSKYKEYFIHPYTEILVADIF